MESETAYIQGREGKTQGENPEGHGFVGFLQAVVSGRQTGRTLTLPGSLHFPVSHAAAILRVVPVKNHYKDCKDQTDENGQYKPGPSPFQAFHNLVQYFWGNGKTKGRKDPQHSIRQTPPFIEPLHHHVPGNHGHHALTEKTDAEETYGQHNKSGQDRRYKASVTAQRFGQHIDPGQVKQHRTQHHPRNKGHHPCAIAVV